MITDNVIRNPERCNLGVTRFHWAAVFAGALVGVGLGFLLNLFAMAIGLSAYSASPNGANVIAIGGVIGFLIGVVASMGAAGFVAGYLSRFYHCYCHGGIMYGFITWSLALILSAILIIPMSHYISFYEESLNPSLTVTNAPSANTTVSTTDATTGEPKKSPDVTINTKHLAWSGWILFAFFFIGALSSCIGACWGMCCKKEEQEEVRVVPPRM